MSNSNTQNLILIAGYTGSANVDLIHEYFSDEEVIIGCVYTREPKTEAKEKYLTRFDILFDLKQPADVEKLQHRSADVRLITCTQERDMEVYIDALTLCNKITKEQSSTYSKVINKHDFKTTLASEYPELVPQVKIVDESLLKNLDALSYPQVIKPSGLAGSILISIVNSPDEFKVHVDTHGENMRKIGSESYEKNIEIITEEYIEGPQYSVNVYIDSNQNVTFCPMSRVITPQEMGSDDSYSALQYTTDEIKGKTLDSLKEAVHDIVKCFDLRSTSAHFDSVLHKAGWKFFEVGLRIGGKRQELYRLSHGMDHFKNDIRNRLDENIVIPEQKNNVCVIQKATTGSGVLQSISYTRNITKEKPTLLKEDKLAKAGKEVMSLKDGGGTIARFFMWGKDQDEVVADSKELFHSIQFDIKK